MKKKMVVSFFVLLLLVAAGLGVLHKVRAKEPIAQANIAEIALNKQHVLDGSQHFDTPGVPDYIVKRFGGKQAFFMEQLDNTLLDAQDLLTEIRTAFIEGQVKGTYNPFYSAMNATIKTLTTELRLIRISEDGTYQNGTKITYFNNKELRKEDLYFYEDRRTLNTYRAPGRFLKFFEDGKLEVFSIDIDGRTHQIFWNHAGQISHYGIDDIRPQNPSDKK